MSEKLEGKLLMQTARGWTSARAGLCRRIQGRRGAKGRPCTGVGSREKCAGKQVDRLVYKIDLEVREVDIKTVRRPSS